MPRQRRMLVIGADAVSGVQQIVIKLRNSCFHVVTLLKSSLVRLIVNLTSGKDDIPYHLQHFGIVVLVRALTGILTTIDQKPLSLPFYQMMLNSEIIVVFQCKCLKSPPTCKIEMLLGHGNKYTVDHESCYLACESHCPTLHCKFSHRDGSLQYYECRK